MNVQNFIDLHVHIGPEIIPRKFTVRKLIKAERGKIKGMALKSHFYPTLPLIESEEEVEDLLLIGSVTLNNFVGGLNPEAIYASAKLSSKPIVVWFPTINAGNFLAKSDYEICCEWVGKADFVARSSTTVQGITIKDATGKLTEEATSVLKAIKEENCILATGHLSWEETRLLVREANLMGIKKIIITHPIYQKITMPLYVQRELTQYPGVFIEHNYAMYLIDGISIKEIAKQIKEIGPEKCILSSDMGQLNSPSPSEALDRFTQLLQEEGITEQELRIMGERNPQTLINH